MKRIFALFLVSVLLLACACCAKKPAPPENGTDPANPTRAQEVTTEKPTEPPAPAKEPDRRAEQIYKNHPELTPVDYDSPALLGKTEDMGEAYLSRLTFVCDSPTYWLKLYGLLPDGYNTTHVWTGPEGTMTLAYLRGFKILDPFDGKERTIPETAALHKPEIVVIAIGVNGISFMDEEYFTREYEHLIDVIREASPESRIVLQSIYPISPKFKNWGSITNASITAGNRWILKIAEKYGLPYMDAFSALVGEDGNIVPELVMKDGLHPNKEGLTRVLEFIRTHAYVPD